MRFLLTFMMMIIFAAVPMAVQAQDTQKSEPLLFALADEYVDITTNFSGRHVVAFGLNETGGDVVITLTGPEAYTIIRKKGQALGIWANIKAFGFKNVPMYYDYAVSKDEAQITDFDTLRDERIGVNAMLYKARSRASEDETRPFHEALIRQKQQAKHFAYDPQQVEYVGGKLFKVRFDLPPDVPTGEYSVKAMSFKDGKKVAEQESFLQIRQVGFSAGLYRYAHNNALIYGLGVVFFAVFFGYGAHAILARR